MSADRRRSSLLFELNRAQSKITTLEEFIRDRERQFHATVVRLEHQDSHPAASTRRRRAGLSHDLLRTRSMSRDEQEEVPGTRTSPVGCVSNLSHGIDNNIVQMKYSPSRC